MTDYEIKVEENLKRNEKYIKEFEKWLNEKNLAKKTIRKHISNINLYINDYLNYYDVIKVEDGIGSVYSFFIFLVYPFIIAKRIKHEEEFLEKELKGYSEYKKKVKYRLIPFVW